MSKEYYLGLDIGTDSVGWAVTNTDYTIPKFRGNAMWGIRLFEEGNTAAERRTFRASRRRTQRTRERLDLLEMLFNEEISKIDVSFFQRLKESSLYLEDKSIKGKYCVFNDENYTDKDFHDDFPTIYHLRKELITNSSSHDVRLVFIALHHIIKNRGNFLFDSLETDGVINFVEVYEEFSDYIRDNYDIQFSCNDIDEFSNVLKNRRIGKTKKNALIAELFNITKKLNHQEYAILSMLSGSSVKLCDIFDDEELKNAERKSITFDCSFDDIAPEYESILGERFELIEMLKAIYDWAILDEIRRGKDYISEAKVEDYEQHKDDLKQLKKYIKTYFPEKYNEVFRISREKLDNYVAYSGHIRENAHTGVLKNKCNQEEFCAYIKKLLGANQDEAYADMFLKIENGIFMHKQINKDNGVIPMQIHRVELVKILDNAKGYLPFINNADENGITVYEKIISLFNYRIPYYIGPLNKHSKKYWLVRGKEKIYPWNIKKVVDFDKSAEAFIENLTSKCTYLPDKDVIPKNSLLYSKFMLLNELNNLTIDGKKNEDVKLKQDIYNDLFMSYNKVTMPKLKDYLKSKKNIDSENISGIDGNFKSSLKSARELQEFDLSVEDKEEIIKAVTIFGDDKKLLKQRLRKEFSNKLTEAELLKIFKLKYKDWSNLSKEFLTDVLCIDKRTGEIVNIITALWQTNDNLNQILYSEDYKPKFIDKINGLNKFDKSKSMKQIVNELYVSPKVKRPIYQSLLIAKEIENIEKCPPKKIFVEVARGEEKKERKSSRKDRLIDLYKFCKNDNEELYKSLLGESEDSLRSDKLYLYYTQMGKCMYTGAVIDFDNLMGANSKYDIDHIYPRSKVKDDSLDNRVLVTKTSNAKKGNDYPIDASVKDKMHKFWGLLLSKKLISQKKYDRLVHNEALSDDELRAFISRQIVETRQSTKAVAKILEQLYPDSEIVYVKAGLVSDFRHHYDMLKCREVNDFHHAKDAYLNIVVGNVYSTRFNHTYNKNEFIKGLQMSGARGYSLNKMFDYNVKGAWVGDNNESLDIVENTMKKNNIRYTRYAYTKQGQLFGATIEKKGGKGSVSLKATSPISDISKYGGYTNVGVSYFALAKLKDKPNYHLFLFPVYIYDENDYIANPIEYAQKIINKPVLEIVAKCLKIDSLISVDGNKVYISGNGDASRFLYKPSSQLVLPNNMEKYCKRIVNYIDKCKESKTEKMINSYDKITSEESVALYSALCDKMCNTVFKNTVGNYGIKLNDKLDEFLELSLYEQCYTLCEILKYLKANTTLGDTKKYLGENTQAYRMSKNFKSSNIMSLKLINQSVTGLFEQEIELLK